MSNDLGIPMEGTKTKVHMEKYHVLNYIYRHT